MEKRHEQTVTLELGDMSPYLDANGTLSLIVPNIIKLPVLDPTTQIALANTIGERKTAFLIEELSDLINQHVLAHMLSKRMK